MSRANPLTTHDNAGIAAWRFKLKAEIRSYADAEKFLADAEPTQPVDPLSRVARILLSDLWGVEPHVVRRVVPGVYECWQYTPASKMSLQSAYVVLLGTADISDTFVDACIEAKHICSVGHVSNGHEMWQATTRRRSNRSRTTRLGISRWVTHNHHRGSSGVLYDAAVLEGVYVYPLAFVLPAAIIPSRLTHFKDSDRDVDQPGLAAAYPQLREQIVNDAAWEILSHPELAPFRLLLEEDAHLRQQKAIVARAIEEGR